MTGTVGSWRMVLTAIVIALAATPGLPVRA